MSFIRRFLLKLFNFIFPARAERELDKEISSHLILLKEDLIHKGKCDQEAGRMARRMYENVEQSRNLIEMNAP